MPIIMSVTQVQLFDSVVLPPRMGAATTGSAVGTTASPATPVIPKKQPAPVETPEKLPKRERVPAPPIKKPHPDDAPTPLPALEPCRKLPTCQILDKI